MKKILTLVIVGAALWSGYWFVGAQGAKAGVAEWLQERRGEDWQVEFSDHAVRGYPNRFDTTITDFEITDPETGLSWSAPFFQFFALSYQPNHLIAVWPNSQLIATPEQKIDVTSQNMRASMVIKPQENLDLTRANLVIEDLALKSSADWTAGASKINAAIREKEDAPLTYEIAAEIESLKPGEPLRKLLDQGGTLPDQIEAVRLDVVLGVSEPLGRSTIETARPHITKLNINELGGKWGELELRAAGDLDIDAAGYPVGDLAINARQWREMLKLAVASGAIDDDVAAGVEFGLGLLANASGAEGSLDVTLSFRGGRSFVGPIPIGPAPLIRLR